MTHPKRFFGVQEQVSTTWTTCTVTSGDGHFCDAPIPPDAPTSTCKRHLVAAFLYCENLLAEQQAQATFGMSASELAEARAEQARISQHAVVYYARIGEHIKIGTTVNLRDRMNALAVDCVLATEPGSYELEAERHRQFASGRAPLGREYFHETEDLSAHIQLLQHARAAALRGRSQNIFVTDEELAARQGGSVSASRE